MISIHRCRVLAFVFCACCLILNAAAEDKAAPPPPPPSLPADAPSIESVQAELDRLQSATGLDDAVKNKAIDLYKDALGDLKDCLEHIQGIAKYDDLIKNGQAEVEELQRQVDQPVEERQVSAPPDATLPQLSQAQAKSEAELAESRAANAALEEEMSKRGERRKALPELLAKSRQMLADAEANPPIPDAADPAPVADAKAIAAKALVAMLKHEIQEYEKELETYEVRGELTNCRMYLAGLQVAEKEKAVEQWRAVVAAHREQEGRDALQEAQDAVLDAAQATPQARAYAQKLAAENVELVNRRLGEDGIDNKVGAADIEYQDIDAQVNRLTNDFAGVKKKIDETAHTTTGLLLLLRGHKNALPDVQDHKRRVRSRQHTIADVEEQTVLLRERQRALANMGAALKEARPILATASGAKERAQLESILKGLLQKKRESIEALLQAYDSYFVKLVDIDSRDRTLIACADEFSDYINQHVLWVRSGPALSIHDLPAALGALERLFSPAQWVQVPAAFWSEWASNLPADILMVAGIAALALIYRRMRAQLLAWGDAAAKAYAISLRPTLYALAATLLIALPGPVVLWWLGYRLASASNGAEFARAFGGALKNTALFVFAFEAVRQALRPGGLADKHFRWPEAPLKTLRRYLFGMLLLMMAVVLTVSVMRTYNDESFRQSLGRIIFLTTLAAWGVFAHALLWPRGGLVPALRDLLRTEDRNVWRYVAYGAAMALLAILAVLAVTGYYFTAYRLGLRIFMSAGLLTGLVFLRALAVRWLALVRRRVTIAHARKKREALLEKGEDGEAKPEVSAEELDIDFERMDSQTYRLVKMVFGALLLAGLWYVWLEELPALGFLKQIKVREGADVSLANILGSIAIGALTMLAAADLPGLIELIILQRMRLLKGERYAITTIVRYSIGTTGLLLAFWQLGIGWNNVQWLVAALGVGLGFGLQEIFANFVSGLIILFERPIRVGDIVTVGGMSGTVSRIRIRATWITDFDRKELIIPNKEFVTSRVTNWTLIDAVMRLVIPISIAHGSDTAQAERLLNDIIAANPSILKDPTAAVVFTGFNETGLNFEMRLFCLMENGQQLQNDLNVAIDKAFREAGISFAVPRREIKITKED